MTEYAHNGDIIQQRAAILETAMFPGGVLHEVAQAALSEQADLVPDDVAEIIMPKKQPGEAKEARWQLVEGSKGAIKIAAEENTEAIMSLAEQLDMRKEEPLPEDDLARISKGNDIWMIEGGANRTSVVRRQLALDALNRLYDEEALFETPVYQLGSDRAIPKERLSHSGEVKENPEYKIAREIAGEYLPEDDSLTEYGLNVATAKQAGFTVQEVASPVPQLERMAVATKEGEPTIFLVQPLKQKGALSDGISAVMSYSNAGGWRPYQPVIVTNGQYRPKAELQVSKWSQQDLPVGTADMISPVVLGDEPGYTVTHRGQEIVTANRGPLIYLNEAVVLHRLQSSP
jgi:hypothetical protein